VVASILNFIGIIRVKVESIWIVKKKGVHKQNLLSVGIMGLVKEVFVHKWGYK